MLAAAGRKTITSKQESYAVVFNSHSLQVSDAELVEATGQIQLDCK